MRLHLQDGRGASLKAAVILSSVFTSVRNGSGGVTAAPRGLTDERLCEEAVLGYQAAEGFVIWRLLGFLLSTLSLSEAAAVQREAAGGGATSPALASAPSAQALSCPGGPITRLQARAAAVTHHAPVCGPPQEEKAGLNPGPASWSWC